MWKHTASVAAPAERYAMSEHAVKVPIVVYVLEDSRDEPVSRRGGWALAFNDLLGLLRPIDLPRVQGMTPAFSALIASNARWINCTTFFFLFFLFSHTYSHLA